MDLSRPFGTVTPTVDGDVLSALAGAETVFTPAQLHRVVGRHSESGIRKSLARLVRQGVVTQQRIGAGFVYGLNREHLSSPSIVTMSRLRAEFLRRLAERFASFDAPPVFAAIFGSAARGEMRPDSDIDLFVVHESTVTDEWFDALDQLADDASRWTGNDVRAVAFSEDELLEQLCGEDPLLSEIRRDGLVVWGNPSCLRASKVTRRA
ncbi:MAG TPA: nucleotidyltransferase domain-containing protein [Nocardioidaceae bacterium]|nr:nucleotidyltransferase domain-containing protein [Nocardioidaceae bacterium]